MKNLESDGGQGERVKKEREISVFLEIKRDESDRDILWVLRERKEKKKKRKKKKKLKNLILFLDVVRVGPEIALGSIPSGLTLLVSF
jgi:hypothetical protein